MATLEHCICCVENLAASLENRRPLSLPEIQNTWESYLTFINNNVHLTTLPPSRRRLSQKPCIEAAPFFVTWNSITHNNPTRVGLRGCIGTFESSAIASSLPSYALMSALRDPRFPPVSPHELPNLSVTVTLLTDFEVLQNPLDWVVGVHGIRVNFKAQGTHWSACYLPDVAAEQRWSREECVLNCMQKSGWNERGLTIYEVEDLKVTKFRGYKESMLAEEWNKWRNWINKYQ